MTRPVLSSVLYPEKQAAGVQGSIDGLLTSWTACGLDCALELLSKAGENEGVSTPGTGS